MGILKDLLFTLIRGGTPSWRPNELAILQAVVHRLPEDESPILDGQIRSVRLVQRPVRDRIVICYYPDRGTGIPPLPYPGYEHCLAELRLRDPANGRRRRLRIMLHDGRLQSLEGYVPAALGPPIAESDVALHPPGASRMAAALDRLEHGRDESGEE